MKPKFKSLASALVTILMIGPGQTSAENLRFGAGQQGSQNYGVNAALAQAFSAKKDVDATVQSYGGATAFLPLLNAGELDVAAVVMPDFGDAIRGEGPYEGTPLENLRLIAALMPSPVGLMVRADAGINSIGDLEGQRVAWGFPAQASLQRYVEGALANGGLSAADVVPVPVASVRNGVEALINGNVDATLFALRAGKVVEADAAIGGIKWLPFNESPVAVASMKALAPEAYLLHVPASAGVVGADGDLNTMAYDYALVTRVDLDEESVTSMTMALTSEITDLAASNKILRALSADAVSRAYPDIQRHPAAAAVLGGN